MVTFRRYFAQNDKTYVIDEQGFIGTCSFCGKGIQWNNINVTLDDEGKLCHIRCYEKDKGKKWTA